MANRLKRLWERANRRRADERGVTTVEYVGMAAVAVAIVGSIIFALSTGGGAEIGRAFGDIIDRTIAGFEGGGGPSGPSSGGGGGPSVGGPGSGTADTGIPEAGRPIMGVIELVEGRPGKPRPFSKQWFKTKWDQFLAWLKGEEQPQIATAPEPNGEAARPQESGFGALLRGESTQKVLPKEGSILGVPVLYQKDKSITADSLREGMRGNVKHYKEYGCLPTSISAVTQYFASQDKGQALSISEAMNLFYDNHMWNPGDASGGDDKQFDAVVSGYGFKAKTYYNQADRKVAIEDVRQTTQNGTPVITLLGNHPVGRHAVVVTGFRDGKVFYNDSYTGKAGSIDEATFAKWWTYPLNGKNKYPYVIVEPK